MRRSGSTWQYHVVCELLGAQYALGWTPWQKFQEHVIEFDGKQEYGIVKTHTYLPLFSHYGHRIASEGRMMAIYSIRNLYDVAASAIRFKKFCRNDVELEENIACIVNQEGKWADFPGVYVGRYENMMSDQSGEVCRIANHLGVEADCTAIANKFSLEKNRQRMPKTGYDGADTLMWDDHIFTGRDGVWREELSQSQIDMVSRIGQYWMEKMGYKRES